MVWAVIPTPVSCGLQSIVTGSPKENSLFDGSFPSESLSLRLKNGDIRSTINWLLNTVDTGPLLKLRSMADHLA